LQAQQQVQQQGRRLRGRRLQGHQLARQQVQVLLGVLEHPLLGQRQLCP
jgi:hypothetical protein